MTVLTGDNYVAALKQWIEYTKTGGRTTVAQGWFSLFDVAGNPPAGTLAVGNTANGIVPTDAVAGYPPIDAFGGGNEGFIGSLEFGSTVACRLMLCDVVFSCGAYAFNANTNLASQPSFAGRLPNTDYNNLQLWVEQVTAATGNQAVSVGYTDGAGTTGMSTGAVGIAAAPTVGRMWQLPLQAGVRGVQQINNVTGSVASAGTFNVHVVRPLWRGRVKLAGDGDVHDWLKVGMPRVYDTSALRLMVRADSTAAGVPDVGFQVVNG